jgi:hypothetical protein
MSFVKAMIVIVIHVCMCRWVGGRCFERFGAIERCMLGLGGRYFEDPVEASSWRGSDELLPLHESRLLHAWSSVLKV